MLVQQQITPESDRNRERLEGYLTNVLQRGICLRDWAEYEKLPVFLAHLYGFFETRIGQTPLLFMYAREGGHTPAEVMKHLGRAMEAFDGMVVYAADRLTAGFRARLIAAGAAFAIPGNQLFIPQLATDLRERFRGAKPGKPEKLSPSAQLVLLFHLLKREKEGQLTPTDLMDRFHYSIMTVSRAFDELAAAELARIEKRGRKKFLSFSAEGRMLIDKAKPLLISPERQVVSVRWMGETPDLPLAGLHALARRSGLSPPSAPPVYAVTKRQMHKLLTAGIADPTELDYESDGALGIWRYDPRILSRGNVVDPLSLFAQFRDDPDERLSMAADQLLE